MNIKEYIAKFEAEFKWFDAKYPVNLARKKKQDLRKMHAYLPDDSPKKQALEIVFQKNETKA